MPALRDVIVRGRHRGQARARARCAGSHGPRGVRDRPAVASARAHRRLHDLPRNCSADRSPRACSARAIEAGVLDVRVHDLRTFTDDAAPHGRRLLVRRRARHGDEGRAVWFAAVESLGPDRGRALLLSPAGRRLDQALVRELATEPHLTLLCGRYEGVDERVAEGLPAEEALDRRLRAVRWRAAGAGADRGRDAAGPRGDRPARSRTSRTRSASPACSITRTTRGRGSSAAWRCPRCCSSGNHAEIERWRRERPARPRPAATAPTSRAGRCPTRAEGAEAAGTLVHRCHEQDRSHRAGLSCAPTSRSSAPATPSRCTCGWSRGVASACRSSRASSSGRQGGGLRETFTVRKISFGVGVERTFPVHSPSIAKLEVVSRGAGPAREALLPARAAGQEGPHQGASHRRREARRDGGRCVEPPTRARKTSSPRSSKRCGHRRRVGAGGHDVDAESSAEPVATGEPEPADEEKAEA